MNGIHEKLAQKFCRKTWTWKPLQRVGDRNRFWHLIASAEDTVHVYDVLNNPLENLTVSQLVKTSTEFHRTSKPISMFRTAVYSYFRQVNPIHALLPHHIRRFNIIPPYTPRSSKWILSLQSPPSKPCISHVPPTCHLSSPSHPPWLCRPNNILGALHIMKLPIIQYRLSSYFLNLWPESQLQHPGLKTPLAYVSPSVLTIHMIQPEKLVLYVLILMLLRKKSKTKYLDPMAAGIPWIQSALDFLTNAILIW